MKPASILIALLTVTAAACTAPGQPPSHPSQADYHDLLRRETDKTQSALATTQVLIDELQRHRITKNYATVVSRQADTDITAVVTDLRQITPPTIPLRHAQSKFQRVLLDAASTTASIPNNWNRTTQLRAIATRLAITAKQAEQLGNQLN